MQIDDAVLEIMKDYVATILRHGRTHAGLQQLLYLSHDFVFIFLTCCRCRAGRPARYPCSTARVFLRIRGTPERWSQ